MRRLGGWLERKRTTGRTHSAAWLDHDEFGDADILTAGGPKALNAKEPISIAFAVPDHPWLRRSDKAAVRIAMTVVQKGADDGILGTVTQETGLNSDAPNVELERGAGRITASPQHRR